MKKIVVRTFVLALAFGLAPTGIARAACGIGSTIWEGYDGTGPWLLALTTDIFTFKGISTTFEIAGCTEKNNIFKKVASAEVRHYASSNFDRLAEDMARGQGEHLEAFAHLSQIGEEDRAAFTALAQENFEVLIAHDNVTVAEFLTTLFDLMAEHKTLSRYVQS
jgi:hypothetical protein